MQPHLRGRLRVGNENRKTNRVQAYAKAVSEATRIPGYIRDLSAAGCFIAFAQPLDVEAGREIVVRVIAEHDPSLPPFSLRLTVRWARSDGLWFCVGGEIAEGGDGTGGAGFASLLSYYAGEA
jgi:hypothetical protein